MYRGRDDTARGTASSEMAMGQHNKGGDDEDDGQQSTCCMEYINLNGHGLEECYQGEKNKI